MANKGVILMIEDNVDLNYINRRVLEMQGYEVYTSLTLAKARQRLTEISPDIILLDVMLPDGDGFTFCSDIRSATQAHILFLTSRTQHEDMMKGFAAGGDDYIKKPFLPQELMARVEAAMRRREIGVPMKTLTKGSLTLDLIASQASINGIGLSLPQKEFSLLLLFAQNEGKVLSVETIYEKVWGQPLAGDKNAVRMAVSRLRNKIRPTGYDIDMVRYRGYVFEKS